jgi:hypothetical protein
MLKQTLGEGRGRGERSKTSLYADLQNAYFCLKPLFCLKVTGWTLVRFLPIQTQVRAEGMSECTTERQLILKQSR